MLRRVDELGDALAPVPGAPDEARVRRGGERLPRPIRIEAGDHLGDLLRVRRDDRVVARLGEIADLPVRGFDEAGIVVDHHRLLVRERERRVAVANLNTRGDQRGARLAVLLLAVAARGIQHHANVDAASLRRDRGVEQRRVGEQEHPDVDRALRGGQRVEQRLRGVVGKDQQRVGHGLRGRGELTGSGSGVRGAAVRRRAELDPVQLGVHAAPRDQLVVRAGLGHDAVLQHDDLVGGPDRREAVRGS